jgi:copper chaperone CopZ
MTKTIIINGMKCEGCANRVKNALSDIEGITSVSVSLEDKKAIIECENVTDNQIKEAITDLDFEVESIS